MTMHKVRVTQVFRAERVIELEVDDLGDNDPTSAVERVESGDVDLPSFDDPRWKTGWDMQNEEVELVARS